MRRIVIDGHDAAIAGRLQRHFDAGHAELGTASGMLGQHHAVVHLVDMVATQHQRVLRSDLAQQFQVLEDGVGGAAVPVVAELLLRRHDVDILAQAGLEETPAVLDMADQALRLVLGQHGDAAQARVDAVGDLDDITVFSRTFSEHLGHLRSVFNRLQDAGLKLKPSKCSFFREEMEFLGHKVTKEGISPLPNKVDAVRKMTPPASLRDVQVFLGMVGYYRQFIPHFSKLAEPLVHLLQNEVPFSWDPKQDAAFHALCEALATSPVLCPPQF